MLVTYITKINSIQKNFKKCPFFNRYTRIDNVAWFQTVFYQFSFCREFRFMDPLLLAGCETPGMLVLRIILSSLLVTLPQELGFDFLS